MTSDPGWARLLTAARRQLERSGGALTGRVSLRSPTDAERRVVIGITGVHRPSGVGQVAVPLAELDLHLRQSTGRGLLETLGEDAPLRDRPGERAREAGARDAAVARALASPLHRAAWFQEWLSAVRGDGTLTRLVRAGSDLVLALRVLEALPAADEPVPVFAERVFADTKALDDPSLRRLVLRAVALWQGTAAPSAAAEERELWESVGVVPDDLASQVLVLNLPASGGLVGQWLTQAAGAGLPLRLTLHQLRLAPILIEVSQIFVVENPAVLRAAAGTLGAGAPSMVCTEGVPSVAVHRLLATAPRALLRWRNDFDWAGVRMLSAASLRYPGLVPWRMGAVDYDLAVGSEAGPPLVGTPAPTPWDPALGEAMRRRGRAVMEERLLPVLLSDMRTAATHHR